MAQLAQLTPGLAARVALTVGDADTAQALGSGDVPVLGTPRVLALAEAATVAATARQLPSGLTTVGVRADIEHHRATAVGRTVTAEATLCQVNGRELLFDVLVRDGEAVVAQVQVHRAVVDRHRFVEGACTPP